MANVKINSAGARAIMNLPEVQSELMRRAESIRSHAASMDGCTYVADVQQGKNRAHAMVKTADAKSCSSNAKHNTIIKSLDAGR